jgi:hypothetical protein
MTSPSFRCRVHGEDVLHRDALASPDPLNQWPIGRTLWGFGGNPMEAELLLRET